MDKSDLINLAESLLSDSKTAVLSTVSSEGLPRMRWMSPVFLKGKKNCLYALTSSRLKKISDLTSNQNVQWMIQDRSLRSIITFEGKIYIVNDLSLRTEVLEAAGNNMNTFWTINKDPSSLVVVETVLKSAVLFKPVEGKKFLVTFEQGGRE